MTPKFTISKSKLHPKIRLAARCGKIALRVTLACLALIATICIVLALRIRNANSSQGVDSLAVADYLTYGRRILIVSPHPDDETLGCGGLITNIKRNGGDVRVVFLTNGDGFRVAVERQLKKINLKPAQFIQSGLGRQVEAATAGQELGLKRSDLEFLGFPDRGLSSMWAQNWTVPFTSRYTKQSVSPYENSYQTKAPYTGQTVVEDLAGVIEKFRPSTVFVTHPLDDHPDHYSAYAFTTAALDVAQQAGSKPAKLVTYLVHRGPWPAPRAKAADRFLAPPAAMSVTGTRWKVFQLKPNDIRVKDNAISKYRSQTAILGDFMRSFGRKNELFGELAVQTLPIVAENTIKIDGYGDDWQALRPQIEDPTGDTVGRALREGADIKRMWLASDSSNIYVRVDTVRRMPRALRTYVLLRTIEKDGASRDIRVIFEAPGKISPPGTYYAWRNNILEFRAPIKTLGDHSKLWAGVSTFYLGFNIDKTGWRPLTMQPYCTIASARLNE